MKRTAALCLLAVALMSCSFLDEATPNPEPEPNPSNAAPVVTLTATPPSGDAPLPVTLTAEASDAEGDDLSYSWNLEGAEGAATVSQTFSAAGRYPVTVTVSDGQTSATASTTVVVDEANGEPTPNPDPDPVIDLSVTPSTGGPVPWGVTYEVASSGAPAGSTVTVTCNGRAAIDLSTVADLDVEDTFSCIHTTTDEAVVTTLTDASGEVLATEEQTADVQPSSGVPFGGAWMYRGESGDTFLESAMFDITQAVSEASGRGEGGYLGETLTDYPEYPDPQPATFTLTAEANKLTLESTVVFGRELIFVGQSARSYKDELYEGRQVFMAPNSQELDSNQGFLYTSN